MSPDNKVTPVVRRHLITDVAPDMTLARGDPSADVTPLFPTRSPAQIARRNPNSNDISFHVQPDAGPGFTVTGSPEDYARVFQHIAPNAVFQAPAAPKAERSRPATVNTTRCLECNRKFRIEGSTYYSCIVHGSDICPTCHSLEDNQRICREKVFNKRKRCEWRKQKPRSQ